MSAPIKLSLLALIASASAIPHYGHNRFHGRHADGYPVGPGTGEPAYPTGGWYPSNSTSVGATGTGVVPDDKTSTTNEFVTSTETLVSTIYVQPTPVESVVPSSALVEHVSSTEGGATCGPETVYVTATNKVTVTVTAGEVPSSSAAEPVSSSSKYSSVEAPSEYPANTPVASTTETPAETSKETPVETPAETPSETPIETPEGYPIETPVASSVVEDKVSISLPQKQPEAPTPTPEASSSEKATPTSSVKKEETPAPSTGSTYSGGKRGLAFNEAGLCSAFAGKASWAYNWGSAPNGDLPEGMSFVPMPWVKNEDAQTWLQKVDEAVEKYGTTVVMGFNEVDHPQQALMDPGTACSRWEEYMNPIASKHSGVTILGPSVTNNRVTPGWGLDWYKNFAATCPQAIYHAANVHFYDIYQDGAATDRFIDLIESAAEQTGKKVWVTEFGLNPGSSPEEAAQFLKDAMAYMDASDKVGGYSYFMVGTGANQLNSGDGLSSIGQIYASG